VDAAQRTIEAIKRRLARINAKIHPALPELMIALRGAEASRRGLGPKDRTPERLLEIEQRFEADLERIQQTHSGPKKLPKGTFGVEGIYSEQALESGSKPRAIAEYVHWHRHNRSLHQDVEKMKAKDHAASRRFQRTFSDYELHRCEQGPIKAFKIDADHWDFIALGWGLGLEKLSPEELADFADWYCPCGGKSHDADNLKQLRLRFKKARDEVLGRDRSNA